MKATKEQLQDAILFFARKYQQEENYKALLMAYPSTPEIVKLIVYEMFLREHTTYDCSEKEFEQYKLIHEYALELKDKGWVVHETN